MKHVMFENKNYTLLTLEQASIRIRDQEAVYALRFNEDTQTVNVDRLVSYPRGSKAGKTIYGYIDLRNAKMLAPQVTKYDFPAYAGQSKPVEIFRKINRNVFKIISLEQAQTLPTCYRISASKVNNAWQFDYSRVTKPRGSTSGKSIYAVLAGGITGDAVKISIKDFPIGQPQSVQIPKAPATALVEREYRRLQGYLFMLVSFEVATYEAAVRKNSNVTRLNIFETLPFRYGYNWALVKNASELEQPTHTSNHRYAIKVATADPFAVKDLSPSDFLCNSTAIPKAVQKRIPVTNRTILEELAEKKVVKPVNLPSPSSKDVVNAEFVKNLKSLYELAQVIPMTSVITSFVSLMEKEFGELKK